MPSVLLTQKLIEGLKPAADPAFYWDTKQPGLGLRVTPNGKKAWVLKYRFQGRQRFQTLGRGSVLNLQMAREEARKWLQSVTHGADPAKVRTDAIKAPTISDLAKDFIEKHVDVRLKPKTAKEYKGMIRRDIIPTLGKIKVKDLKAAEVQAWHQKLAFKPRKDHSKPKETGDGGNANPPKKAVPCSRTANLAHSILRKMLKLAKTWGYLEGTNPAEGVQRFKEHARERVPTIEELKKLAEKLREAERGKWFPASVVDCLRLLILTGARKNEIRTLKWTHVDLERRLLILDDSKTGKAEYALCEEAVLLLKNMPKQISEWVFPSANGKVPTGSIDMAWIRIRKEAGCPDLHIHDLRHNFGTLAAGLDVTAPKIQAALNHRTPAMTSRYINLKEKAKLEVADAVGGLLGPILTGEGDQAG